jgi:oligosaccharide repeat unit polymerase
LTRSGILFGLLEYLTSYLLYRHLITSGANKIRFSRQRYKAMITVVVVLLVMIAGASAVKLIRNPTDEFQGTSNTINQFKGGILISPSIYFYAASQIGVLNQYLESDKEHLPFGNSTFFAIYTGFSKFDLTEKPNDQHEGYMIPYWSNTATYLRDLHSDFGYSGVFIFPFLLGLFTTYFWVKFYQNKNMINHVILVHLYLIIGISFFILVTRFPAWFYGFGLFLILIPLIEKLNSRKYIGEKS